MKSKLALLLAIISLAAFGQKDQTVDLKWKIGENEKLNYLTIMSDIDSTSIDVDFSKLFDSFSDDTNEGLKNGDKIFNKLNKMLGSQDYVTTLTNQNNGVIDIVMNVRNKDTPEITDLDSSDSDEDEFLEILQQMNQGVMLRGSVYETGEIHSFWVKSNQKNLIALFFELPTKPVKIGDKWSLDINLIANDQNFECTDSSKINEVTLVDIKKIDGETIAVLKYNILEHVEGKINTPSFFGSEGGTIETMLKFNYQGIANFSVGKGRWVSYDGIMELKSTGIMSANQTSKYALIDEQTK